MTPKQERFVQEYLIDLNATQAAIRAGYSVKTARQIGEQNLSKLDVASAISQAQEKRAARTEITQDMVLRELAKVGFQDPRKLMVWGGESSQFIPSDELDDDTAATVASVKSKTRTAYPKEGEPEVTVELEIKTYDKVQALTQIGRHLGMFHDRQTVDLTKQSVETLVETLVSLETDNAKRT